MPVESSYHSLLPLDLTQQIYHLLRLTFTLSSNNSSFTIVTPEQDTCLTGITAGEILS